ncbi:MAG: hypothetical protein JWO98_1433 [Frankiales bacterium]|nr:hypothetical protein [Frankiales bacterium]
MATERITVYVQMSSVSGSTQELVLEGDDIPAGWDQMTDQQKSDAMQDTVQAHMENEVQAGWYED